MSALHEDARRLLATFENGPRIWDAAAVFAVVVELAAAGLVEPVPDSRAYAITPKGRAHLGRN